MSYPQRGFTLIELMVTLAVLAIVIAMAVPSFNTQIQNSRAEAMGDEFISALTFARTEAVKRAGRVSLCATTNGTDCNTIDWSEGWIVFQDFAAADNAAPLTISGTGVRNILRWWDELEGGIEITVKSDGNNAEFIRFTSLGALARLTNPPTTMVAEVKHEHCSGDNVRQVTVGLSGMVSVTNIACPPAP